MRQRVFAWLLLLLSAGSLSIWHPTPQTNDGRNRESPTADAIDFTRDIAPILSANCYACHGPDARKGGLRLDQRDAATKKARSGAMAIVPGKPAESSLWRRITSSDESERMPPAKFGKTLTDRQKDLLKRWIAGGAEYQRHWAFVKPARPALPAVKNESWPHNPIDRFVLVKLEAAGLQPSPLADRVTLIRRLSLDLRGIPPSLDEVDAFMADRSVDAYPKLVERMLASPHFGEKMALSWLDLARYGDTSGYHMDSTRHLWLWRDWVINAFNQDMPFDQFTIEQLAGDLQPGTQSSRIASGFNRNTRFNEEGGVDPEEYVIRYTVDRTNTLGQIWLGLTLGCAECHSHKYDPISHKEYWQLSAFFSGITEPMLEGNSVHGKPLPPLLHVPSREQTDGLEEHRKNLAASEKVLLRELSRFTYVDPFADMPLPAEINEELAARSLRAWQEYARQDQTLPADVQAALMIDHARQRDAQKALLRTHYLRRVNEKCREGLAPFEAEVGEFSKKITQIEDAIPHTLVTVEMAQPRAAHTLIRGDFQQKGERVTRKVAALLGVAPDVTPDRLGLARWLVSADNPLTARVAVNRLWAQMFGHGIVRTLGDFGTQGDLPSHPELLDWLACEFKEPTTKNVKPWDVKHILRTIALSSTYQQASVYRAEAVKLDAHNRLLSFMPRHRLGAEELRDSALAISGLINPKIGGPSFMPYQPKDYYKFKNEDWPWTASAGEEQYRRGIYAFWRRTALHPMFVTLDAPSREECVVMRGKTNTPLQALVTLNDPTFVEAARVFAQKLLADGPKDIDARLAYAFRKATCRTPNADELTILRKRFEQHRARFAADADAASSMINAGQYPLDARLDAAEHAAWTALCNLLLNLDEVLTRE